MGHPSPRNRGFSLLELLLVLVIVGVLAMAGLSMLGNPKAASVRSLLDELEGALGNARQLAVATGRDVGVYNWGTWNSTANPLVLAYGDNQLTMAQMQAAATSLLHSQAVDATVPYSQTVAVPFHYLANDMTQMRARIVLAGSGDWAAAMAPAGNGAANSDLTALDPFLAGDAMNNLAAGIASGTTLFTGAPQQTVIISGSSQRFTTPFIIEVVGTSPSAGPLPGGPMGLLVVLGNGASIYKFYNPGVLEGNGQWRRI
jgi:prepilin-type N-terminal cleavage/methylation domain-containing protein